MMSISCHARGSCAKIALRTVFVRRFSSAPMHQSQNTHLDVNAKNVLGFANQTVFAGKSALEQLADSLAAKNIKTPQIVTDQGVLKAGMVETLVADLKQRGMSPVVFDSCKANPGVDDIQGIAKMFLDSNCDGCVGLGGGGPLDAAKGGMALVATTRAKSSFDLAKDSGEFVTTTCRGFSKHMTKDVAGAVPLIAAIPTTAGTGSEGGKSAVITDTNGVKVVFGHPSLMPTFSALVPQFTVTLPESLTLGTGIDAMFHCLEPLFCPYDVMVERDGMTDAEIKYCDGFGEHGLRLVAKNLPLVMSSPEDLQARLNMQLAALYGAKAFRKGDLGGVHATAHSLGAVYHLHHGTCVGRMAVHVLAFNEKHPFLSADHATMADTVRKIFNPQEDYMFTAVRSFLGQFGTPLGIADLVEWSDDIDKLAALAAADACQTNPVELSKQDYKTIFEAAAQE